MTSNLELNNLFKFDEQGEKKIVSARQLHDFLETKDHFTQWCKRMFEHGFVENIDYEAVHIFVPAKNGIGGTNKTDYALSIDCAKEIAMVQRTEKGKQARLYFIECENKLNLFNFNEDDIIEEGTRILEKRTAQQRGTDQMS